MQPGTDDRKYELTVGANLIDVMPIFEKLPKRLHWWRKKGESQFNNTINTYKIPWYLFP
jgi:hypothetical protein